MSGKSCFISSLIAIALFIPAQVWAAGASNEFRFIGFTGDATNALPDTIDSGQGMLAMHAHCQDHICENARK